MGRKGQGLRQRMAESERRQRSAVKRLRRLARRKAKRERIAGGESGDRIIRA
jgi:hypothetical protein